MSDPEEEKPPEPEKKTVRCDTENLAKIQAGLLHPLVWPDANGDPVLLLIPTEWSVFDKAQASVQLEHPESYDFKLNLLALITLLRTNFSFKVGSDLLSAGWLPHEVFAVQTGNQEEDPIRKKFIEIVFAKYPNLLSESTPSDTKVVK